MAAQELDVSEWSDIEELRERQRRGHSNLIGVILSHIIAFITGIVICYIIMRSDDDALSQSTSNSSYVQPRTVTPVNYSTSRANTFNISKFRSKTYTNSRDILNRLKVKSNAAEMPNRHFLNTKVDATKNPDDKKHRPRNDSKIHSPPYNAYGTTEYPEFSNRLTYADQMPNSNVFPESYDLFVKIYLPGYKSIIPLDKERTYEGKVVITLSVVRGTNLIELNSHEDIKISSATLLGSAYSVDHPEVVEIEPLPEKEKVSFHLSKSLKAGHIYKLEVIYSAPIAKDLSGLYLSSFKTREGEQRLIATTQLESVHGRKFVPCFDQPHLRANWTVTVVHPQGTTALSNGIELVNKPTLDTNDFFVSRFATTPKTPSYLLAVIIVSDYAYREGKTNSGVRIRVWSRKSEVEYTKYALKAGIKCLEFYEKYFNFKYALPKLDMIGIPDFAHGAMENWGLITFREISLLYNHRTSPPSSMHHIAIVIAHEIAHQWFGNLVTLRTFSDGWLKEAMASYFEFGGVDVISDGHMEMSNEFVESILQSALDRNRFPWTSPVTYPVKYMDEINHSDIATCTVVINMIRHIIGGEAMRNGIQQYLHKNQYGTYVHKEFLEALGQVAPKGITGPDGTTLNVTKVAFPYFNQAGYPRVNVKILNETHAELSQKRHNFHPSRKIAERSEWDIPLFVQEGTDKNNITLHWLPRGSNSTTVIEYTKRPLIINADSHSFFITNYSPDEWKVIFGQLNKDYSVYSPKTRSAIIRSAFEMLMVHKIRVTSLPMFLQYLKKETHYLPLRTIISRMTSILSYVMNTEIYSQGQAALARILGNEYKKVDLKYIEKNHTFMTHYVNVSRMTLIYTTYCKANLNECGPVLGKIYNEHTVNCTDSSLSSACSTIPAPLRSIVYCYMAQDPSHFEKILDFISREQDMTEIANLYSAFDCVNQSSQFTKVLELANRDFFREQDVGPLVFKHLSQNPLAGAELFSFLKNNWLNIQKFAPLTVSRIVSYVVQTINNPKQYEALVQLADSTKSHLLRKQLAWADFRVKWLKKNKFNMDGLFSLI